MSRATLAYPMHGVAMGVYVAVNFEEQHAFVSGLFESNCQSM